MSFTHLIFPEGDLSCYTDVLIQLMYLNADSDKQFRSMFSEIAVPSPLPLLLGCLRSPDNSEGNVSPYLVNVNIFLMIINTELTFHNFFQWFDINSYIL